MSFTLRDVVPWGRSFDEYTAMFALSCSDLTLRILDIGGGPSSFTATLNWMGGRVTAADPIYAFSAGQIRERINEARGEIVGQMRANMHEYVWDGRIPSLDALVTLRTSTMDEFWPTMTQARRAGVMLRPPFHRFRSRAASSASHSAPTSFSCTASASR